METKNLLTGLYDGEKVEKALHLVALGTTGLLHSEEAVETLHELPEDLAKAVMGITLSALAARKSVEFLKAILDSGQEGDDILKTLFEK